MATRFDLLRARPGGLLGLTLTPEEEEQLRLQTYGLAQPAPAAQPVATAAPDPAKRYSFGDAIYELGLSPEQAIRAGYTDGADPSFVQRVMGQPAEPAPEQTQTDPTEPPKVLEAEPLAPVETERKDKAKAVLEPEEAEQALTPVAPRVLDGPPDEVVTQAGPDVLGQARARRAAGQELERRAQQQGNVEVESRTAAYAQRVTDLINSPEMFKATPDQMREAARRVATEEFKNPDLFALGGTGEFNFDKIAEYRQKNDRPSPVGFQGEETAAATDAPPTFTQSVAKGGATTMQLVWAGGEVLAEVAGADGAAKVAGDKRRYYGALANVVPEGVKFDEAFDSFANAMQWAKQVAGEQGVLMAGPITGAVAGKLIAGSVGARLGAFGPSWALGAGEIQTSNKQVSETQKAGVATLIGGAGVAALDSIFNAKVGSMLVNSVGREAAEEISLRVLLMPMSQRLAAVAAKGGKEAAEGAATEFTTEAAQTVIGELTTAYETGTPIQPDMLERLIEAGTTGALMGGTIGGATGSAQQAAQQRGSLREPIREMADAQFATPASSAVAGRMSPSQGTVANRPRTVLDEAPEGEVVPQRATPPARPATRSGDGLTPVAPTRKPVSADGKEQDFLIPKGRVSSRFGPRKSFTTDNGARASSNHAGIDIAMPRGAVAPSGADGVVVFAGKRGGYGNQVVVKHSDGTTSSYSHLGKITVQQGDTVAKGARVGTVGSSGNATGPHLHLERRDAKGRPVNPLTAGPVETVANDDGSVDDNTEWDVKQEPLEELPDFLPEETEAMEETWAQTTGTTMQYDDEPVVEEAPAPPPSPRRDPAAPQPLRDSPVPEPEETLARAEESLTAAQDRNPARIALEELRSQPASTDLTQPLPNEEPVFAQDESGAATQEVVGFITPEGAMRRIGEAPLDMASTVSEPAPIDATVTEAPPVPQSLPSPTGEAGASSLPTPEENRAAALDAIIAALPPIPERSSAMVREARTLGRQAGVGATETSIPEGASKSYVTAYNLGVKEGAAAVAKAGPDVGLASLTPPTNGPTPVATESSAPVAEISEQSAALPVEPIVALPQADEVTPAPVEAPAPEPVLAPAVAAAPTRVTPPARGRPTKVSVRAREIDAQYDKIDERLFDLENEGDKAAVKRYAQRLVREGVIEQDELNALSYMFKDRDMGAEDITGELRTSVQLWADREKESAAKPKRRVAEGEESERGNPTTAGGERAPTRPVRDGRDVSGSAEPVDAGTGADTRNDAPRFDPPLRGAPGPVEVPGYGRITFGPIPAARTAAEEYMATTERRYNPPKVYGVLNTGRAKRIADAFEVMEHAPQDPEVQAAYRAMIDETIAQYRAIAKTGLKIEFIDLTKGGDPYAATPRLAQIDVAENNHLWVFKTDDGFGSDADIDVSDNPLLEKTDIVIDGHTLRANDVFRIVHDYFGHFKDGHGFRARGEENAWQAHAAMYSPLARRAMTTETRGQNSWVNYGPYGEQNRSASASETHYAPQKIGLLPEWVSNEGMLGGDDFSYTARSLRSDAEAEAIADARRREEQQRERQAEAARAEPRGPEPNRVGDEEVLERPPVEPDGTVILDHWSAQEGLTETDPAFTAINKRIFSREERSYLSSAPQRTYFGIQTGRPGGYKLEFTGRGKYQARIPADRLYDAATDPDGLWQRGKPAASERAIQAAGYAGYWVKNGELGLVALVFEKVPVTRADAPAAQEPREAPRQRVTSKTDSEVFTETVQERVRQTLRQMGLEGHPGLTVEIVDRMVDEATGWTVAGEFDPTDMVIRIAAFSGVDVRHTTKHEVIHWARESGLINRAEYQALATWAKNDPYLMAWAKENYPTLSREEQIEEAVAEGFARWNGGMKLDNFSDDSIVGRAFAKLRDFIRALRMAFNRAGITRGQLNEAAQILHDIQSGQQALKDAARRGQKPTFGRKAYKDRLSKDLLSGRISPEEHHFLRQNPDTKYQAAWHGSPAEAIDRFSLDFIGQGEGAQAFGWGLYFAQKRQIAEWYQKKLTMESNLPVDQMVMVNGQTIREFFAAQDSMSLAGYEVADRVFDYLTQNQPYNGWLDALEVRFHNEMDGFVRDLQADPEGQAEIDQLEAERVRVETAFRALRMKKIELAQPKSKGALYKVEVPDDDMLLDLDVELDQQPAKVKAALAKLKAHLEKRDLLDEYEDQMNLPFEEWTGADVQFKIGKRMVYDDAMPFGDEPGASDALEAAVENSHAAMASSILLRNLGIPGNRYLDRDSRSGVAEERTRNFVIFDDGHIELKAKHRVVRTVSNSPLSDPANPNPGLWRRIHDQTMGLLTSIGSAGRADSETSDNLVDAFKRKVTNRYNQIQKTQARSAAMRGVNRLPAGQNPMEMITADERGYKLQFLTDNMIRPMAREMSDRGVSMDDLGLYLYARHAPARNARIALINPEFRDPANPGSGMSDVDAAQIMADFATQGRIGDLSAVAQHIDAMIAYAQQERLDAGLLSPADIAAGFGPGDFYVPLRGNENVEPEHEMDFQIASTTGGGFSVAGQEGHRMYGRASRADLEEIVGYTLTQAQQAIDRGYRNRVGQSMLAMFRATPDPDFVQIDRVKRVAVWNAKKGQVEYQMQTRIASPEEKQRTLYVKENGEVTKLTFVAKNPSAMRFVKAAKNLSTEELGVGLRYLSLYTRLWSKANTQWNVDFILANAVKDVQTGVLNASTLNAKGLRRAMLKNIASLKPVWAAWSGDRAGAGGLLGSGNPWLDTYAEFEANGGKLNYNQTEGLENILKQTKREIRRAGRSNANPIKWATGVFGVIDSANSAFENMTRLAAYKALRDMSVPAKQAAEAVRELTTNFQQHGEWGPKFNAAYGFANASVIGGSRFLYTVATNRAIIAGLVALGMASDMLNHMLDDDEWDRYSESEKHASLMILLPESVGFDIKIPAGYGLNAFITTGRKMSELWRGKKNKDGTTMGLLDAASDVGMGFVNAFAPITGSSFFNIITPTVGDPVVDIWQNQNNWDRPIMPEQSPWGVQKPDSQLAFDNTAQFWKTLATTMNNVGGGNEVIPGWTPLDMSPETYKYFIEQQIGGAGRTFTRMAETINKAANDQPIGPNDLPIVRRFAGLPTGAANDKQAEVGTFYERVNQLRTVVGQAKEMKARWGLDSPAYKEFRKDNEKLIEFRDTFEEAEKRLRALSAAENAAEKGAVRVDGLDAKQRKAIFKGIGLLAPTGKKLTDEQLAKVRTKVREKKEALAIEFNAAFMRDVMKEGQPKPTLPVKATASGG